MKFKQWLLHFAAMGLFMPVGAQNLDIDTITVTASRQSQTLNQLSSNIAWLDDTELALLEPQHIQQALARVAGAWISRGNGQEHLTALRSPVLTGAGSCGAFFMAEDGIALRAPGFCNANQLFDVNSEQAAQIEVVLGSNSALYGSNAVHGVINVISPDAFQPPQDLLSMELGPHDYYRAKFRLSTQEDEQAWLVYGNATTDGGYQNDSGFDQQKLNLIHQAQYREWAVKSMVAVSNLNQQTAGFIEGFEVYKDKNLRRVNNNPEAFRNVRSLRAYSQFSYQADTGQRFTLSPYVRANEMEFLQHYLPWQALEKNAHNSVGIQSQFVQQFADISLLSGFDWDQTWGELTEFQAEPFSATIPQGMHYDYAVRSNMYSPYAQLNWQLSAASSVLAGLRYEHTVYDYNNHLSDGSACQEGQMTCRFMRPADTKLSYNQWSQKLALQHQLNRNTNLYAQWSLGHRVPEVTELFRLQQDQTSAQLEPEKSQSLELGFRLNTAISYVDIRAFYLQKDHVILQDTERQNINNGSTSHRGLELNFRHQFDPYWYVSAASTYALHRYDSALTISLQDITHNEIDTAPKHLGSAQLGWQSDETQVELEWLTMGKYYLDPENTATYAGHQLFNLRASTFLSKQIKVSLRLLNLSNVTYAERADIAFGNYRYFVGEPRSVFVSLAYLFE